MGSTRDPAGSSPPNGRKLLLLRDSIRQLITSISTTLEARPLAHSTILPTRMNLPLTPLLAAMFPSIYPPHPVRPLGGTLTLVRVRTPPHRIQHSPLPNHHPHPRRLHEFNTGAQVPPQPTLFPIITRLAHARALVTPYNGPPGMILTTEWQRHTHAKFGLPSNPHLLPCTPDTKSRTPPTPYYTVSPSV